MPQCRSQWHSCLGNLSWPVWLLGLLSCDRFFTFAPSPLIRRYYEVAMKASGLLQDYSFSKPAETILK